MHEWSTAPDIPAPFEWSLVSAVNDERVLGHNLLASPAIGKECQFITERGFSSIGQAYNQGLAESEHDIVVFAHQDLYLPEIWLTGLRLALRNLARLDPAWGVLGSFGIARSIPQEPRGFCYSTGLKRILGASFSSPIAATSLDELVLVVRKSSGLNFDEALPGFHLYGTDICLQAEAKGMGSYIIPAFCVHNANGVVRLPYDFWRAYFYLRRKWRKQLPVSTCCTTITKSCVPVLRRLIQEQKERLFPRDIGRRCADVKTLHKQLSHLHPEILTLSIPQSRDSSRESDLRTLSSNRFS